MLIQTFLICTLFLLSFQSEIFINIFLDEHPQKKEDRMQQNGSVVTKTKDERGVNNSEVGKKEKKSKGSVWMEYL